MMCLKASVFSASQFSKLGAVMAEVTLLLVVLQMLCQLCVQSLCTAVAEAVAPVVLSLVDAGCWFLDVLR